MISVVCVCLMLVLAGAQAIHAHPASFGTNDHDCSVCSVIHASAVVTSSYQVAPLLGPAIAASATDPCNQTLLLVRSLDIRPPPSV